MTTNQQHQKLEYGDFQTPLDLAYKICKKLHSLGVKPDLIIDPTCGIGNFLEASSQVFIETSKIIGIEINSTYLRSFSDQRIEMIQGDFLMFKWNSLKQLSFGNILILGNFPWITNSKQAIIGGNNLPPKNNFQKHSGLDAITGKSNFDISEWMLIKTIDQLQNNHAYLGMLCKTSVTRKILNYISSQNYNLKQFATYKIDAKKYFNVAVDASLLFCEISPDFKQYFCSVFENLETSSFETIGYHNKILVRNLNRFKELNFLYTNKNQQKWRSGLKHDCSKVMELRQINDKLTNGFNETVDLEDTYLFPLLKSSDIANNKTSNTKKYVLVTQRNIGESTDKIEKTAPKTWEYLQYYADYLDRRKSKIYQKNPKFSIFGIGDYSFLPWKIAISGLYKQFSFRLINTINNKPVMFDDTVYFLAFEDKMIAEKTFDFLTSKIILDFYSCLTFWDEKRPIKASILNRLDLIYATMT
ncbi:type II restriction enzyme NspV-like protein [Rippkaea orientalis PCC 8801]|uniref:Type II restriction enzyme NspV-like protein n=1 Tax=Rippkaea orientalis (strain PCC 8801 / RF-1) TaxID=41431 RepID=B7K321_RIPO1|nr:restriction endonuclease subunit M [Rippkaea orientalis]ACK67722.1 type II restriction enzyme NspV-like protein [Rippkaea orientalis PCC 8801]